MADLTSTLGVNSSGETDVIADYDGVRRIVVQENYDSSNPPTADLLQRGRIAGSAQVRIPKGTPAVFTCPGNGYTQGQKAGTVQTSSGSITVQKIQSSRI